MWWGVVGFVVFCVVFFSFIGVLGVMGRLFHLSVVRGTPYPVFGGDPIGEWDPGGNPSPPGGGGRDSLGVGYRYNPPYKDGGDSPEGLRIKINPSGRALYLAYSFLCKEFIILRYWRKFMIFKENPPEGLK